MEMDNTPMHMDINNMAKKSFSRTFDTKPRDLQPRVALTLIEYSESSFTDPHTVVDFNEPHFDEDDYSHIGKIYERYSENAAKAPEVSWFPNKMSAEEIAVPNFTPGNRAITNVYTRQCCAFNEVDMAAAKTAAITGIRPDAFTVGYGYGKVMSAPAATKQRDVRLVLKEFASQFIKKAYPALMRSLVKDFRRESTRLLPSDMIQYIYLTAFCTSFHRRMEDMKVSAAKAKRRVQRSIGDDADNHNKHSFDWGPVAATMDLWSFSS